MVQYSKKIEDNNEWIYLYLLLLILFGSKNETNKNEGVDNIENLVVETPLIKFEEKKEKKINKPKQIQKKESNLSKPNLSDDGV
jgi:hypothetical protein